MSCALLLYMHLLCHQQCLIHCSKTDCLTDFVCQITSNEDNMVCSERFLTKHESYTEYSPDLTRLNDRFLTNIQQVCDFGCLSRNHDIDDSHCFHVSLGQMQCCSRYLDVALPHTSMLCCIVYFHQGITALFTCTWVMSSSCVCSLVTSFMTCAGCHYLLCRPCEKC